jgi:hypothetical protein
MPPVRLIRPMKKEIPIEGLSRLLLAEADCQSG